MADIFLQITIIISLAAFFSIIFKVLKQPLILAYILTGVVIGPLGFLKPGNAELLKALSEIGITLLLFLLGLEIRITELPAIGKVSTAAAVFQVIIYAMLSYFVSVFFHFPHLTALYIAIALTFSSTIIVVKLISDKHELSSLYGKISVGILLVQDFIAILVLIFLSGFNKNSTAAPITEFAIIALKAVILFSLVWYLSKSIFPKVVEVLARSTETLFLVSIAWVFLLAAVISSPFIGFSIEIGGFLAGLALANSIANYQIIAKAKILRDFFIVLFFVVLGMQMAFGNIREILPAALVLSLFVLVVKPLLIMIIVGLLGYRKRTAFLSGITLSQISEFSLILVFLGNKLGHIPQSTVSLIALVSIITFAASNYMTAYGGKLYKKLSRFLHFLEIGKTNSWENVDLSDGLSDLKNHVVLIGADQMGQSILNALEAEDLDVIVVDFDPKIVKKLKDKNTQIYSLFGDISDLDIQKRVSLDRARLVISTIPDIDDNLLLIKELNHLNKSAKIVVMALDAGDAKILYKHGADYVVLPHLAGGMHVAKIIRSNRLGAQALGTLREKDKAYIS